jgi:hypothetical protein
MKAFKNLIASKTIIELCKKKKTIQLSLKLTAWQNAKLLSLTLHRRKVGSRPSS